MPSTGSRTDLLAHFQQLIASQATNCQSSNQSLTNYFFIHSQHSEKEGRQERMEQKLRYYYQYHHNHPPRPLPPQTLTDEKVGGENKGGRTSENSVTLTLTHTHSNKIASLSIGPLHQHYCKQFIIDHTKSGSRFSYWGSWPSKTLPFTD